MANAVEYSGSTTPAAAAGGTFLSTLPVVMALVVIALVVSMVGGEKALRPFLWLVLLSMVVVNSRTIADKLNSFKGVIAQ